mgnify:CR=1 FL=1
MIGEDKVLREFRLQAHAVRRRNSRPSYPSGREAEDPVRRRPESPPIMKVPGLPPSAPGVEPVTGASRKSTPFGLQCRDRCGGSG